VDTTLSPKAHEDGTSKRRGKKKKKKKKNRDKEELGTGDDDTQKGETDADETFAKSDTSPNKELEMAM